jgi:hypothetical protein
MKTPLDNDLNKVYEAFNQKHDHLREALMTSLPEPSAQYKKTSRVAHIKAFVGDTIIRSRITKFAVAAIIVIAISVTVNHLGKVGITAPAFADVIKEISRAHSVIFKQTIYSEGEQPSTSLLMVSEDGRKRWEMPDGRHIAIYNSERTKQLRLTPESKTGMIIHKVGRRRERGLGNHLDWLRKIHNMSGELIRQEKFEGRVTNIFFFETDFQRFTIWVDPEIGLPVRVEKLTLPPDPEKKITVPVMSLDEKDFGGKSDVRTISISGDGVQAKRKVVWSDFVWNPELDESVFSLEPPEDYSIEELTYDLGGTDERGLIDALAFWAEMSEGSFPTNINEFGDPNKIKPMLIEKFDRDGDPKEEFDQAMRQMHTVLKGLWFAQKIKVENDWHYVGKNVKLGDAESPVCWYRPKDSEIYHVIYGDLSIKDVTPENLPK